MRVQSDTELIPFQDWTLRVRPGSAGTRVIVLLHGWTGDENSMWVFVRNFSKQYWMIAPRALHPAQPFGYTWRHTARVDSERPSLDDLHPAADVLIQLLDAYAVDNHFAFQEFDVLGFSQGAALANTLALLYPERIGRVGILAGFMPSGSGSYLNKATLKGKPFFVAHGTLDETVKIEQARQSVHLLTLAGADVTFCEDEVGHKLSAKCLRELERFFEL